MYHPEFMTFHMNMMVNYKEKLIIAMQDFLYFMITQEKIIRTHSKRLCARNFV